MVAENHDTTAPLPMLRVLAADDNEINRTVMAAFLDQLGVDAVIVEGGEAAVEAWRGAHFDVVLLDVVMPGVDGPEALRRIASEARAEGRHPPPAIAVTGHASATEISACLDAGFAGHLAKPIDAARLARTLAGLARVAGPPGGAGC